MADFFGNLFSTDYMPHGHCMYWQQDLVWLHVLSDGLIALAYYSIPLALFVFYRQRKDLIFPSVLLFFAAFIFACGSTHLLAIITLWEPIYRFDGIVKAVTAGVSLATAIILWPMIPKARNIPSTEQLKHIIEELNHNIAERVRAQKELEDSHANLQKTVEEKTTGLRAANNLLRREITRREELEKRLLYMASIIESTEDAVLSKSLDGIIESWNKSAERIYGYKSEEIIGKPIYILLPPEHEDDITPILEQIGKGNPVDRYETVRVTKDGRRIHVSLTISPIKNHQGTVIGASTIARDITDQKDAQRILRESEERFRNTFEQAAVGMAHVDSEGRFIRINKRYCDIVGYSTDEIPGLSFQQITHPDDLDADIENVRRCINGEIDNYAIEKRYIRKNGSVVWVKLTVAIVRKNPREGDYFIAVVEDISDRVKAQRQLESRTAELSRSNEELEQFAYIASHDLKEPLRKITAFGERLNEHLEGTQAQEPADYLQRMTAAASRMTHMIDGLLAFSRFGRTLHFARTDLDKTLDEVLGYLERTISESGAEIKKDKLPVIEADSNQMVQLFQNLIGNALKFRKKDQRPLLEIRLNKRQRRADKKDREKSISISIKDNGIGFDTRYKDKIFGLFQRLHGRSEYDGSGIGLSICKKIVDSHGGEIEVASAPGEGSTFTIRLPLKQAKTGQKE